MQYGTTLCRVCNELFCQAEVDTTMMVIVMIIMIRMMTMMMILFFHQSFIHCLKTYQFHKSFPSQTSPMGQISWILYYLLVSFCLFFVA